MGCMYHTSGMDSNQVPDLKDRTKAYALRVIRLTEALPRTRPADVIGKQRQKGRSFKNGRTRRKKIDLLIRGFPRHLLAPFG